MTALEELSGQDHAVETLQACLAQPVQSYLFVGPPGVGKLEAARAFAADLLASDDADAHRRILQAVHPDVLLFERTGAALSIEDVTTKVMRAAMRTSTEAPLKVLIVDEVHLLADEARGAMLKVVEEPPPSTVFVLLAEQVPDDLVTIASRCLRVEFALLSDDDIANRLRDEGVAETTIEKVVAAAAGRLDRARQLSRDDEFFARADLWASIPRRLDGGGSTVIDLTTQLLSATEQAMAPIEAEQKAESRQLAAREKELGTRGSGKAELEKKHRRQLRRVLNG